MSQRNESVIHQGEDGTLSVDLTNRCLLNGIDDLSKVSNISEGAIDFEKALKKLLVEWVLRLDDPEALLPHLKSIKFLITKRKLDTPTYRFIPKSLPLVIEKDSLADGNTMYCVGCLELSSPKTFKYGSSSRRLNSEMRFGELKIHLYLIGFISGNHRRFVTATEISAADDIHINGIPIQTPSIVVYRSHLTTDPHKIAYQISQFRFADRRSTSRSEETLHSSVSTPRYEIDDSDHSNLQYLSENSNSPENQPVFCDKSESFSENQSGFSENEGEEEEIRMYLYLFGQESMEPYRDYLRHNSLELVVMERLEVLCKLCKSKDEFDIVESTIEDDRDDDIEDLKKTLPSLSSEDSSIRDRLAIHFLCSVCCRSEEMEAWFLDAERILLGVRLRLFAGLHTDMMTLYRFNTHILPPNFSKLSRWYGLAEYTVDQTVDRLKTSLTLFRERIENIKMHKHLVSLTAKTIEYISDRVNISDWCIVGGDNDGDDDYPYFS
jgi:hypothetical protein